MKLLQREMKNFACAEKMKPNEPHPPGDWTSDGGAVEHISRVLTSLINRNDFKINSEMKIRIRRNQK